MKRCALVLVAVLLLLSTLVGCGTFSYDITDYVEMGDYKNLTLKSEIAGRNRQSPGHLQG